MNLMRSLACEKSFVPSPTMSPRIARMFCIPLSRSASSVARISSRVEPIQVRCASAGIA